MLIGPSIGQAQEGLVPFYTEHMLPGTIGQLQNMKGRGIPGYVQPVKVVPPPGSKIAPVIQGNFTDDLPAPQTFGCLIGAVYRFRITNIPLNPGAELYPTIEVIDRTYPPAGMELQFPIPVYITQQDLEYALDGKFVTRVIYLENPRTAIPNAFEPGTQPWFEVQPGEDPVVTADSLGRPVAIMRLGSRRPMDDDPSDAFTYQSPPIQLFGDPKPGPEGGVMVPIQPPIQPPLAGGPMMPNRQPMVPPYGVAPQYAAPPAPQYAAPPQMARPNPAMPPQAWYPSQR